MTEDEVKAILSAEQVAEMRNHVAGRFGYALCDSHESLREYQTLWFALRDEVVMACAPGKKPDELPGVVRNLIVERNGLRAENVALRKVAKAASEVARRLETCRPRSFAYEQDLMRAVREWEEGQK
jgi:hypothetical protein